MSKVTIVLPIYNVEQYLTKCFESILNQSFKEYKVLSINDGSTDNSLDIINEYVARYPKLIKNINKVNGGYGSVLEYAFKQIDTEYTLICDPDDYLEQNALLNLYNEAHKSEADIVIGAKVIVYNDSDEKKEDISYNKKYVELKDGHIYQRDKELYNDLFFVDPSPHSKLYRTSIIKSINFPKKTSFTDNLLYFVSLLKAEKVVYIRKFCSFYLIDRTGNTMTNIKPKVILDHVLVFSTIIECSKKFKQLPPVFYYRMFESYKYIFREIKRINCSDSEKRKLAKELYLLVELLKPYKKEVEYYYNFYDFYDVNEKKKDLMLFGPLSKSIYSRNVNKLLASIKVTK